jgi:hypothetical protein
VTWVKLSDQDHGDPSITRVWQKCPDAVGLHYLAKSYCGSYLTDGFVPAGFVDQKLPDEEQRTAAIEALIEVDPVTGRALWSQDLGAGGFTIEGFLDENPSRRDVEKRRRAQREGGRAGAARRWANP